MEEFVQIKDRQVRIYYHGMFEPVQYCTPPESANYHFAGFDFRLAETKNEFPDCVGHLMLDAILHNPEEYAYLSYHTFNEKYSISPPKFVNGSLGAWIWTRERAAAWLIAHWFEHFMHSCPCQFDDAKPSGFREAFIETLLYLEEK